MSTDKLNLMAPGEYIIREGSADQLSIQKLKTSHYITWIGRVLRKEERTLFLG